LIHYHAHIYTFYISVLNPHVFFAMTSPTIGAEAGVEHAEMPSTHRQSSTMDTIQQLLEGKIVSSPSRAEIWVNWTDRVVASRAKDFEGQRQVERISKIVLVLSTVRSTCSACLVRLLICGCVIDHCVRGGVCVAKSTGNIRADGSIDVPAPAGKLQPP
jgi:hypothetical protein